MYVVIGANGYVGSYMIKNLLSRTEENILAIGRHIEPGLLQNRITAIKCDIANHDNLDRLSGILKGKKSLKAVYLAAFHHPDEVKRNPRLAWDINITALADFVNRLPYFDCLFYVSTEMVYGSGDKTFHFKETDALNPVNLYGRHKQIAESIVTGYGYNVVRFPFMIGPGLLPGKRHFYDDIVETVRCGRIMEMFADAYKSALDFNTAAATVVELMLAYSQDMPKILNVSGDEDITKYEIGIRIIKANGLNPDFIHPIYMDADKRIFTEKRASCTLLDNSLVKKVLKLSEIRMKF